MPLNVIYLFTLMFPSHFAVVGWFPAAKVIAARQNAATNVNPNLFIIPTF